MYRVSIFCIQHLLFVFLMIVILPGVRWNIDDVLSFIFLYRLRILNISSYIYYLFVLLHLLIGLVVLLVFFFELFVYSRY
jgi:hypothetical protein